MQGLARMRYLVEGEARLLSHLLLSLGALNCLAHLATSGMPGHQYLPDWPTMEASTAQLL